MKEQTKVFIRTFFFAGIVYAGLMAGSNYHDGLDFNLLRFLFHFIFFGLFMGLMSLYNYKKQLKKSDQ